MAESPSEKRTEKIIAHVPLVIKDAVRKECYARSRPGESFSESDLILEMLRERYTRKSTPSSRSDSRSEGELPPSAEPPEVGERHTPFDPGPSLERKEVEDARATPRSRKKHEPTKK